uniref:Uncharacterized protein n=1 Tax=Pyxicephalus adspersus TaxID=30357 RepID=A0AAV3A2B4_PYXAD|nr:TPA: hypothetical protein GDO54_017450 [Pyxicephalus adspersus]
MKVNKTTTVDSCQQTKISKKSHQFWRQMSRVRGFILLLLVPKLGLKETQTIREVSTLPNFDPSKIVRTVDAGCRWKR